TDERAVNGLARQLDGAVPLALRSCLAIVGEVWLCGSHPDWSPPTFASDDSAEYPLLADPLVLPPARWVLSELAEWDSDEWVQPKRPWRLGWAPDELHKAGISGSTHDLELPDACPDPVIYGVEGRPGVTLVEYLRTSCRWAGFPGFEFTRTVP